MRIATWNVNSLKARLDKVEGWLAEVEPDVLCLQETKCADDAFPALTFAAAGYEGVHHGEGRWNGVGILSRVGIDDVVAGLGGEAADDEARAIAATCGGIRVVSVYVPNGRAVGHEQWDRKLEWLEQLGGLVERELATGLPLVVAGDFNIAPDDRDVWDPRSFVGSTHVSPEERGALAALLDRGLVDVFRRHHDADGLFSWWDYRAGNFHKKKGMRIDLVLASSDLAERSEWALVDRNARKGQSPSDHAPLIVGFRAD